MNDILAELVSLLLDGVMGLSPSDEPAKPAVRVPSVDDRYAAKVRLEIPGTVVEADGAASGGITATLMAGDVVRVRAVLPERAVALIVLDDASDATHRGSRSSRSPQYSLLVGFDSLDRDFELLAPSA